MKNLELKIVCIYISLIIYLLIGRIIFINEIISIENFINPIIWFILFIITFIFTIGEKGRYKSKIDKVQVVFIVVLIYLMIYFSSGLIVGYVKTPYSHSFTGIVSNIWSFLTVIIFQEYIRGTLVSYTRKRKYLYILIVIIFTLFEINFYNIGSNFNTVESTFKYISSTIFPSLVRNCLFTYLVVVAGASASLMYRLPITFASIVLPILPDYNWFLKSVTESVLPLFIYTFINKIEEDRDIRSRRRKKSEVPILIIFLIIIFFVAGFFKYKPISVMSNSMASIFYRGDVVIVKKIDNKDDIDVQDIIEYELDGAKIIHRIIQIKVNEDGEKLYKTKGDNNNAPDIEWVKEEQILGVVKLKIPKIGYPSVWLSETFNKSVPRGIETPK